MALQEISDETQGSLVGTCSVTMDCSTLLCSTATGYTGNFEILPCNNPPGIHAMLFNQQQNKVYDEILTDTTTLTFESYSLYIYITQLSDGIGLKVSSERLMCNYELYNLLSHKICVFKNSCRYQRLHAWLPLTCKI